MKKRIAICYSGMLRGDFQKCFETFKKHVLDVFIKAGYEFDIYIHTWNFIEDGHGKYTGKYTEICDKDESIKKQLSIFNAKDFLIERFQLFEIHK